MKHRSKKKSSSRAQRKQTSPDISSSTVKSINNFYIILFGQLLIVAACGICFYITNTTMTAFTWMIFLSCFIILLILFRIIYCLYEIRSGRVSKPWKTNIHSLRTMIILGSGGHTTEMISLLKRVDRTIYNPLIFVRASSDHTSEGRVKMKESEKKNIDNCSFLAVPRSREVGQSYFTSIFTTLYSLFFSIRLVFQIQPHVIITNGPGTCIPLCVAAFLRYIFLFKCCPIIFVESFCRVKTLSLSGKILYPFCTVIVVQWQQLLAKYPRATYIGTLC